MIFKPLTDQDQCARNIHESKRRHSELLNQSTALEGLINSIVSDKDGSWHLSVNGVEYTAFASTVIAVGPQGTNVPWRKAAVKLATNDVTILVGMNSRDIYYVAQSKEMVDGKEDWRTEANIVIQKDDWHEAHHDARGEIQAAMRYLYDELRAITNEAYIPEPERVGHAAAEAFSQDQSLAA